MKILLTGSFLLLTVFAMAQNVGIGTNTPSHLLSVNGSILIDAGNMNTGTNDSASLRFGTGNIVAISSNRSSSGINRNGLDFWTGNSRRMMISIGGFVGINITDPVYRLDVGGSIHNTGNIVVDGSAYISSSASVTDYMGIGTDFSSAYRLNVNGNALIGTNLGVNGTLRVDGKLTNEGRAIMLSNSGTTLRSGFAFGSFNVALNAGQSTDVVFGIPTFSGNNNNVRVMVAQLVPGTGASNWGAVQFTPHSVDPSDAANGNVSTVRIRMQNNGSSIANLGTNAALYLFVVVTH